MTYKYCIGKASRYQELEKVNHVPLAKPFNNPPDREDRLRLALYDTVTAAHDAAVEAGTYNPVGFVVLLIEAES